MSSSKDKLKIDKKEQSRRGKKISIEFNETTLWKTGTIVFGVLFVIAILTGGFGKGGGGVGAVPSIPSQVPTQAAPQPSAPVDVGIGDAYVKGDKNAPVEIIEFSDFECPFCGKFYSQTLGQIQKKYIDTGKVKLAYKHLPLPFHPNAQKAGEAAECAGEVGGSDAFWAMHDGIFDNMAIQAGIEVPKLKALASDIGLDQGKFDSCLDNGDMEQKVKNHLAEASSLGASGTPTFFVNGVKLVGAQPYQVFEQAIEAALN